MGFAEFAGDLFVRWFVGSFGCRRNVENRVFFSLRLLEPRNVIFLLIFEFWFWFVLFSVAVEVEAEFLGLVFYLLY
jgi:hypothetical protein